MQPSTRLPRHLEPNPLSVVLAEQRATGADILDLTLSNPTESGILYPADTIRAALSDMAVLRYRPDPQGDASARNAVAKWHGRDVTPDDVILTASTSESYAWLFKLLGEPGDQVLVPSPSYPLFEWLARLESMEAVAVPAFFHERWNLDLEALERACTARCRAVIVVNPNNPTGQFLSKTEWQALTRFCVAHGLALIVDEVFSDYALESNPTRMATVLDDPDPPCPVFVLSGLSKIAALPQIKLGWIIARGPARDLIGPLVFLADQYLSVSTPASYAAPELLRQAPVIQDRILARLRTNLRELDNQLNAHPHLSRMPVEGGWTVLLRRPAVDSDESAAIRMLREASVLVHPGHYFDLPGNGHLVLSLLTPEDEFARGLTRMLPLA